MPERRPFDHARPLDALLPELADAAAPLPASHVHARVLELDAADGTLEWVICVWSDPGGARALHEALRPLVEATLLSALSEPPGRLRTRPPRHPSALHLLVFARIEGLEHAVAAFGLKPNTQWAPPKGAAWTASLRQEAELAGVTIDAPLSTLSVRFAHPDGELARRLEEIQTIMLNRLADDVWGATPGGPSRLFASCVDKVLRQSIEADTAGLDTMELLLGSRQPGVVRWIGPVFFQALCDFIGAVAFTQHGANIQWAMSEPSADGHYTPPHFRLDTPGGSVHVPVGLHVLRWCVMPLGPDESVDRLSAWVADQFAPSGAATRR